MHKGKGHVKQVCSWTNRMKGEVLFFLCLFVIFPVTCELCYLFLIVHWQCILECWCHFQSNLMVCTWIIWQHYLRRFVILEENIEIVEGNVHWKCITLRMLIGHVTPYSVVDTYHHFKRLYYLLKSKRVIETVGFTRHLILVYRTAWCHISEGFCVDTLFSENLWHYIA